MVPVCGKATLPSTLVSRGSPLLGPNTGSARMESGQAQILSAVVSVHTHNLPTQYTQTHIRTHTHTRAHTHVRTHTHYHVEANLIKVLTAVGLRIAMDSVALEGDRLLINSGKSNIILDCTMDPQFSHKCSPVWSFERDKQSTTQALPWGVHSFWADQGKVFRLRINRIGSEQAGKYTCTAGILNRTLEIQVNKGATC